MLQKIFRSLKGYLKTPHELPCGCLLYTSINTVSSGDKHAGVEKANDGNLTIGSESGEGELTANGGPGGAGIGGGGYNTDTGNQVDGSEIEPDTSGLYTTCLLYTSRCV